MGTFHRAVAHNHIPGQIMTVSQKIRKHIIVIPLAEIGRSSLTRSKIARNRATEIALRSNFL